MQGSHKPEKLRLEHHKIFIQSTSQGSVLNKGEKILYLKEIFRSQITICMHEGNNTDNIVLIPLVHQVE
jgi:hypothetical protein